MMPRRLPPPWSIEEANDACFIVRDSTGKAARLNFANLIIDTAKKGERSDLLARPWPNKTRSQET